MEQFNPQSAPPSNTPNFGPNSGIIAPKKHLMSLTPQEWETLIDDFQSGESSRREQWIPAGNTIAVLELALLCLLRREFPVQSKLHLLIFIEEFSDVLVESPSSDAPPSLASFVDFVSSIFQFSTAELPLPISIKDQALVSVTSFAISLDAVHHAPLQLQLLVELLLTVVNRPNQGPDRQTRSVACECLRELENSFPCLLSDVTGHIWILSKNERTHASQSYTLLLTSIVHNIVAYGAFSSSVSLLSTSVPLVPFNIPEWVVLKRGKCEQSNMGDGNLKEIRNVMSFLLDRPTTMTPLATMEMVSMMTSIISFLELHSLVSALVKVQFLGLLYSYDPVLWHVVLMLYSHFSDAFAGDEQNIFDRLSLVAKESHQPLIFRLLALHWLFGITSSWPPDKNGPIVAMSSSFYPSLFDPLALKIMKLDVLTYIATHLDSPVGKAKVSEDDKSVFVVKLFEDGLVCVSAFEWLPVWSTETAVAFRMLHKFLIGPVPHLNHDVSDVNILSDSTAFRTLQTMLVKLAFENRRLVPIILDFFDRVSKCEVHRFIGEKLLKKMDEDLLPMLDPGYQLHFYFPIFDKICENDDISPHRLLVLLGKYMFFLVEKHGPDTGLRSWSQGSKVLGICRKMLLHHHSSRVFRYLSSLLAFTCQFFPDLEVRDNGRIYLRMLLSIPGKKLRHTLSFGEQLLGVSPSLFQVPLPHLSPFKKVDGVSSYIHIERAVHLLVKQSWSIVLPDWNTEVSKAGPNEDTVFTTTLESDKENEEVSDKLNFSKDSSFDKSSNPNNLLRVMDSKATQIVQILRKHFECILDFRHISGVGIEIPCNLWFEAELFSQTWDVSFPSSDGVDELPALYASVIKFSSAAKYGSIPSCRVPFILGEPAGGDRGIIALESVSQKNSSFRASVMMELEPQEPLPGIVDVTIEANGENGQIITGSLQSIAVGMEDMFLKVFVPPDVPEDSISLYLSDLFNALWEACGNSSITGREGFPLKGGKGVAAINGTRSVKLVGIPAISLISCIEMHLAPFVVSVIGDSLIDIVQPRGVIRDIVWKEDSFYSTNNEVCALMPYFDNTPPLQITYLEVGNPAGKETPLTRKRNIGTILIMIFMPPRFHLLFQMEVSELSTLVRIRTDHWPCLAHVDEYLEALFYS